MAKLRNALTFVLGGLAAGILVAIWRHSKDDLIGLICIFLIIGVARISTEALDHD